MPMLPRLAVTVLAALAALVAVAFATGTLRAVATVGNSMEPRIHAGDLVLIRDTATYAVGDSAAYRSEKLDTVVLHRIVAIEDGRFTFQGDNNSWLDPERPTQDDLIGTELLHLPGGGIWLNRLTSPTALGLLAFLLVASGGTAARTRHHRSRRSTVPQHAARTAGRRSVAGLPSWATTTAAAAALAGVLGATLGVLAWSSTAEPTVSVAAAPAQQMTFSYRADVPESPAYDDTTVTSPQPVFRKLADTVEVRYAYEGPPGTISVDARLSTLSGWTSTVPLAGPTTFETGRRSGAVALDLDDLEARAQAAAEATGMPADQVDVAVVPTVRTADAKPFRPALRLTLTPLQLRLTGAPSTLRVGETDAEPVPTATTPAVDLLGRELPVPTARRLAALLLAGAVLGGLLVALVALSSRPATEAAAIRRRYAHLMLEVEPVTVPDGQPVVDVVDFATLAKLAERYELMVLHWARGEVETFLVQDQGTAYRFRTGAHPEATVLRRPA